MLPGAGLEENAGATLSPGTGDRQGQTGAVSPGSSRRHQGTGTHQPAGSGTRMGGNRPRRGTRKPSSPEGTGRNRPHRWAPGHSSPGTRDGREPAAPRDADPAAPPAPSDGSRRDGAAAAHGEQLPDATRCPDRPTDRPNYRPPRWGSCRSRRTGAEPPPPPQPGRGARGRAFIRRRRPRSFPRAAVILRARRPRISPRRARRDRDRHRHRAGRSGPGVLMLGGCGDPAPGHPAARSWERWGWDGTGSGGGPGGSGPLFPPAHPARSAIGDRGQWDGAGPPPGAARSPLRALELIKALNKANSSPRRSELKDSLSALSGLISWLEKGRGSATCHTSQQHLAEPVLGEDAAQVVLGAMVQNVRRIHGVSLHVLALQGEQKGYRRHSYQSDRPQPRYRVDL